MDWWTDERGTLHLKFEADELKRLNPEDKSERPEYSEAETFFHEILRNAGLDVVDADDLGALTGNPYIVTDGLDITDHGTRLVYGEVWSFDNYMLRDPWEDVDDNGVVQFNLAEPLTAAEIYHLPQALRNFGIDESKAVAVREALESGAIEPAPVYDRLQDRQCHDPEVMQATDRMPRIAVVVEVGTVTSVRSDLPIQYALIDHDAIKTDPERMPTQWRSPDLGDYGRPVLNEAIYKGQIAAMEAMEARQSLGQPTHRGHHPLFFRGDIGERPPLKVAAISGAARALLESLEGLDESVLSANPELRERIGNLKDSLEGGAAPAANAEPSAAPAI